MSLEHMENFQTYGIGGQALLTSGIYSAMNLTNIVADPDPSGTGLPVLGLVSSAEPFLRYVLNTAAATIGEAVRIYMPNLPTSPPHFMTFNNASLQRLGELIILPTGQIQYINGSGTVIGTSSLAQKLTAQAWHHVEVKILFSNGAGTVEIRVDGVVALTLVAVNTVGVTTGTCSIIELRNTDEAFDGTAMYFKDWVIWNTAGTLNNDFFGTVSVISLVPNSDTALGAWSLTGAATGWDILNNAPPVDTAFLDAAYPGGVGSTAQFGMTDCPIDVTSVRALQTMVRATKTDGGDGNLQASLVSGASVGAGANRPITAAFTYWKDVFEVDPATGLAWTVSAANAAELKLVRTV
jgi:hypothetical protein